MDTLDRLADLISFRHSLYSCFGRRADALFELTDALLTAGPQPSPAHLSLEPIHRRGWGSLYAALSHGTVDTSTLQALLAHHPLRDEPLRIYGVDCSVWARCDAEASRERGYYYHPSRHSAGQPIVAGWSYQWIAQLGFARDSWTAPVDVRRVHPHQNPTTVAVGQIKNLLDREPPCDHAPLFVFDAGYDTVQLSQGLEDAQASILVRLRSDRCFYSDPVPVEPSTKGGRPRKHGAKLDCKDSSTWPPVSAEHRAEDQQYGRVHVQAWANLHPKQQNHPTRGTRRPRSIVRGTLVRVEVTRLPGRSHLPKVLWLWWQGPGEPDLGLLWRAYVRRFDLEHTFRFLKQVLSWTTPRVRHPEQADRWSWLVLAAYTQLRLARGVVADRRLPWERRLKAVGLTPCRVRRGFPALLVTLGSPASAPKPCGRSPGRPKGSRSGRAPRYPALKKVA
ncbi:MAG: transposase [Chloroflexota bacterium]|jgi:hypothetical protein|nr:transposase [Chloroflexota bacterium]